MAMFLEVNHLSHCFEKESDLNSTHFNVNLSIFRILRDILDLETLIRPTSHLAFQMFSVCFGACLSVFIQIMH